MSTIFRTGQIFGAGYVIDVLRGSQNAKIEERRHNALSVYGIGKDKPKEHWNSVLRQLLNLGHVAIKNWEYRSLGLSPLSREIMTGKIKLDLRKQKLDAPKTQAKKEPRPKSLSVEHGRKDLFSRLKELRLTLAREKNVPPYVVFSDKSLNDMCLLLPRNSDEFLQVNGVGRAKLETYGEVFLSAIRGFSDQS
jgi:ATP-dependent DNA helicase RecQ